MLRGGFGDTSGRPYFAAFVRIPLLGSSGQVSFAIDTGADRTVLMPTDGQNMGVDYDELERQAAAGTRQVTRARTQGIGGSAIVFVTRGQLSFLSEDGRVLYGYALQLLIYKPTRPVQKAPSLLGREIIDQWRSTYDKPGTGITAKVLSSDVAIDLPAAED